MKNVNGRRDEIRRSTTHGRQSTGVLSAELVSLAAHVSSKHEHPTKKERFVIVLKDVREGFEKV